MWVVGWKFLLGCALFLVLRRACRHRKQCVGDSGLGAGKLDVGLFGLFGLQAFPVQNLRLTTATIYFSQGPHKLHIRTYCWALQNSRRLW